MYAYFRKKECRKVCASGKCEITLAVYYGHQYWQFDTTDFLKLFYITCKLNWVHILYDFQDTASSVVQYLFTKFKKAILDNSSAVAEMGERGHNRHAPKRGAAVPLSRDLGPRLVQCGLRRRLLPYQAASSSIQPFGYNRHGPKIGWGMVG